MHIREPYRAYGGPIGNLPRCLGAQGVTLHAGRNLIKKVTIQAHAEEPIELAVKAFRVPARPRGLLYAHLRPSKARRSMVHAEKLLALGVGTPDPVACIEYVGAGCLRESYYICRHWPADTDLRKLLYNGGSFGDGTGSLLEHVARFTHSLHEHGVRHLDYNPGNILARSRGSGFDFALVDLNRLRFKTLDMDERISGLVRLTPLADYRRIIGEQYAALCGIDAANFCRNLEKAYRRFAARRRAVKRIGALIRHEH